jgi:hypothetical protein
MAVKTVKTEVDSFTIRSGMIACTDPCYQYPDVMEPAENGKWMAHVEKSDCGDWGVRVKKILVHHKSFSPIGIRYKIEKKIIGVDSGQAGVFDASVYNNYDDSFYDRCCRTTLTNEQFGYIPKGFVTSSGFGDGGYQCLVYKKNGNTVAIEVTFIEDE